MQTILAVAALVMLAAPCAGQEFPSNPSHTTSLSQEEMLSNPALGATLGSARELAALALDLIKDFEAWVPRAYNDASNYCTIGYGHLIAKAPCVSLLNELQKLHQPMSVVEGFALLNTDTVNARLTVQNAVTRPLTDEQFGALTSFVFNVGSENFRKSTLLSFVNEGEFDLAARQFGRWVKSKGMVLAGLTTRRTCEATLFKGDLAYGVDHQFRREDCAPLGAVPTTDSLIDISVGEMGTR